MSDTNLDIEKLKNLLSFSLLSPSILVAKNTLTYAARNLNLNSLVCGSYCPVLYSRLVGSYCPVALVKLYDDVSIIYNCE